VTSCELCALARQRLFAPPFMRMSLCPIFIGPRSRRGRWEKKKKKGMQFRRSAARVDRKRPRQTHLFCGVRSTLIDCGAYAGPSEKKKKEARERPILRDLVFAAPFPSPSTPQSVKEKKKGKGREKNAANGSGVRNCPPLST